MNRLKELRIHTGLTVRALSSYTGIDYSYLTKLELGKKEITEEMAIKLGIFFGVDAHYVLGEPNYEITCYACGMRRTVVLNDLDIKTYGQCYTSLLDETEGTITNVLNSNIEDEIIKEKEAEIKLLKKLLNEKEIVDGMDNWSLINLLYAKEKIDYLLKTNKKR